MVCRLLCWFVGCFACFTEYRPLDIHTFDHSFVSQVFWHSAVRTVIVGSPLFLSSSERRLSNPGDTSAFRLCTASATSSFSTGRLWASLVWVWLLWSKLVSYWIAVQQEKPAPQRRVLRRSHCCSVIDVDVASHQMHGLKKYNATKFSFAQTGMNMVHPLSNRFAATSLLNNDSFAATSLSNNYSFAATSLSNNPFQDRYIVNAGTACWLGHRTRDRKVASWNPGRSSGRIFFSRVIFVCWLLFGVRSTPILPQWYVKDPGHSAQSAGGRCWLHLNTHTPLIQQRRSGLTTLLSRHSVGTYQETSQPQSSQPAEPLWTEPGMKSGISVRELISTSKKKVLAGND